MPLFHPHNERAFTILEVLIVLTLIAVFAAIAVARQPSPHVTLKAQKLALESHIRYAQMRSMDSDSRWGIAIDPNDDHVYWLFEEIDADSTQQRFLPGEDGITVDLTAKDISISSSDASSFRFDTWGRPMSGGAYRTDDLDLVLQKSDGSETFSETLVVTAETGFVQ